MLTGTPARINERGSEKVSEFYSWGLARILTEVYILRIDRNGVLTVGKDAESITGAQLKFNDFK